MLQFLLRPVIVFFGVALLVFTLIVGCISDGETSPSPLVRPSVTPETPPDEDAVITIGNLSDLTGVSATAMEYINMALDDLVEYYNENNLIPGIRLKVVTYDGQMNPSRDIPGYEWLKEKGADLIFTAIPAVPVTLKPRVDNDEIVMFAMVASIDDILPPGYVFNLGIVPQYDGYTMLKWIAENDWDYQTKGPAKIGGAAWSEAYSDEVLDAMEEYCAAHPDQFEWEGGYLTNFSFFWPAEVEALKDCDYVYPGIVMKSFVEEYRNAGYTKAKFIGSDTQAAFFDMVDSTELWDEIDGMLFLKLSRWWNEEGEIVNIPKQLVHEKHPDDAETIINSGVGYMAMNQIYSIFVIIANAVEAVGPQNFNSQALYDAATSFTLSTDGVQRWSFDENKRDAVDAYAMYEARVAEEDIFRIHDEWYPTLRNP